jgi:hypothetical protein
MQGFMLAKQMLYYLSHASIPFFSVILEGGGLVNYLLGWPQNVILRISASHVARITGVSHQCQAYFVLYKYLFVS